MKKSYLFAFLLIVVSIVVFISASGDVTSYGNFEEAIANQNRVKINGVLAKDKDVVYNPNVDENSFSFFMLDSKGTEQKVILTQPKPQDFERSEQVVVTGSMKGDVFIADEVLLKCPSKYKGEELQLRDS